jgi:KipI family sensor histidine kinase inhibitor
MTNPIYVTESCLQWSFGDDLDEATIHATLSAFRVLNDHPELCALGVTDLVPSYNKIVVHYPGSEARYADIGTTVAALLDGIDTSRSEKGALHTLIVDYSGEDLDRVASHSGLSVEDVIALHAGPDYLVAMVGFRPHFPYLYGLPPALATPRLETPRLSVPAGAVAIGGAQTGVYPAVSPGGWNLIGRTDPAPLRALCPGDRVRFIPGPCTS